MYVCSLCVWSLSRREYICGVCVCVVSLGGGESVCVGLYINVPYNLVKSLKCYTLNCLKDVIF